VSAASRPEEPFDLLVVGGGVNGAAIARDAAGRGLRVLLCEREDLAGATSSASSKLAHGGLRYLERFEFRLVREALAERERLLRAAPHLVEPLRFVLPHVRGLRPRWMLRLGLFLYDRFAGRTVLPGARSVDLTRDPLGRGLRPGLRRGFAYSDCQVDDARLVVLLAVDAAERGAEVRVRTAVTGGRRVDGLWELQLQAQEGGADQRVRARAVVNAAGPWVAELLRGLPPPADGGGERLGVRLVQGSHLVVPRLHPGRHAFLLQNPDGRVVFVIPWLEVYHLIGTTDRPLEGPPGPARPTPEEVDYLLETAGRWLARIPRREEVVWTFAGIRPLVDDGRQDPSKVTREYRLVLETEAGRAPLLSVYGGKLTTCRSLAEKAMERLRPFLSGCGRAWTATAILPGGNLPDGDVDALVAELAGAYPGLPPPLLRALARRHGSRAFAVLGEAREPADLGRHFGADLYEREVVWFGDREWAGSAEDVLWRRSKAGLVLDAAGRQAVAAWFGEEPGPELDPFQP